MSVAPQKDWGLNGRDGCVMGPDAEKRLLHLIMTPGALEAEIEADRQRSYEDWLRDPLYPIRNVRAHGVEPSEGALNALDGPAICDRCGASDVDASNGEVLRLVEDICYGCGHIVCSRDSCATPGWCVTRHDFSLHGATP